MLHFSLPIMKGWGCRGAGECYPCHCIVQLLGALPASGPWTCCSAGPPRTKTKESRQCWIVTTGSEWALTYKYPAQIHPAPVSHPLISCSPKMDQIASLWFLSKMHLRPDFSLQSTKFLCKIHEVANTPFPTSIRQLSETGKFCREQVIASSSNSSSTNTAELKSQQWKKWKQRSFWINMTVTHNLFWLTKPVVSTLG